jgi:lipoprotein-anchoring transpeptidase ErfK/SrfK
MVVHLPTFLNKNINMNVKKIATIYVIALSISYTSCDTPIVKKIREKISYKKILDRFKSDKTKIVDASDTANLFDNDNYDPSKIDSNEVLQTLETVYQSDSNIIQKIGGENAAILTKPIDSTSAVKDTFTNDIKKIAAPEVKALKYNLDQLKTKLSNKKTDSIAPIPTHKAAAMWADVSKKDQRLYLYVEGECVDTFKISSGDKKHTTPNIDRRPSGPQFAKYTSKKYPGGNYNGLGNMPYVLFVQGGYGLHGTTIGNIKRLGTPVSHGCIRLHPDNAKIIFELAKAVGVENTWVTIRN